MKNKRSNFQPDSISPYPDSIPPSQKSQDDELTAMLECIEADQALDATLNELEAIDVDSLTPEQLGEALLALLCKSKSCSGGDVNWQVRRSPWG